VIVFGDKPFILKEYAKRLKVPVGTGNVGADERAVILDYFLKKKVKTIILSSIGDTAIDLPDASVVI
jgi:DNA excision repair protein ERCC-3